MEVKLLAAGGRALRAGPEPGAMNKERAMRRRQLKGLVNGSKARRRCCPRAIILLMKLGAAKALYPAAWRLIHVQVIPRSAAFTFKLRNRQTEAGAPPGGSVSAAQQSKSGATRVSCGSFTFN